MIDNIDILKPLLKFETDDDFYFLQILQRKKENPQLGSNSRVIKNYYINSTKYLEDHYYEIKQLCMLFNARAMLRLNKRSYSKVGFKTMINVANTMGNGEFKFLKNSYARACGQGHNEKNKTWIVDIDDFESHKTTQKDIDAVSKVINGCLPEGEKIIKTVKSINGYHLITKPFNVKSFLEWGFRVDIHKDNPTNLYIP